MLVKYRPVSSLLGPLFNESMWAPRIHEESEFMPRTDVLERKDEYVIYAEMPGVSKKEFHVDLENDVLILSGEKKSFEKTDGEQYSRVERQYGNYKRSFRLGDEIDKEKISARYNNGVLEVILPKSEVTKPKSIEIKVN